MNKKFAEIARIFFCIGGLLVFLFCIGCNKTTTKDGPVNNPKAPATGVLEIWMKIGTAADADTDNGAFPIFPNLVKYPFLNFKDKNNQLVSTGITCRVGCTEVGTNIPIYPPVVPYQCNARTACSSDELGQEGENCGGFYKGGSIVLAMINLKTHPYVQPGANPSMYLETLTSHVLSHEVGHGFITNHAIDDPNTPNVNEAEGNIMAESISVNEGSMANGIMPMFNCAQMATIKTRLGL